MKGKTVGYLRVSTVSQNHERQLDGVELDKVFEEKVSAKTKQRPKLQEMLNYIREGDTVVVHDISRLARNLQDLHSLINEIVGKGASLRFIKENLNFTGQKDHLQELMLNMLGSFYQFERSIMLERQREGIAIAKAKGKFTGRKKTIDDSEILELVDSGMSISQISKQLGISKSSVQRAKRRK